MKPNESKLIKDFVGALLSVFFYRDPCCTCTSNRVEPHPACIAALHSWIHGSDTLVSARRSRAGASDSDRGGVGGVSLI